MAGKKKQNDASQANADASQANAVASQANTDAPQASGSGSSTKKPNEKKKKKGSAGVIKLKNRDGWNQCDGMIQHLSEDHMANVTAGCVEFINKYLAENGINE